MQEAGFASSGDDRAVDLDHDPLRPLAQQVTAAEAEG